MKKLVITLLVLVGLAVAADFAAAAGAEYQVEQKMREEFGADTEPSVRINGFPFITQALVGHYSSIDIRAAGITVGPLQNVEVEATMRDVDAPLSEVTDGNLRSVRAAEVDGRARIRDTDVGRAIRINDLRIQPASTDEIDKLLPADVLPSNGPLERRRAAVRLVATTNIAGERTAVIGIGLIELSGGDIQISTVDVRLSRDNAGAVSLPRPIMQNLMQTMTVTLDPGGLPFAVTPTRVWVENGSLVVEGTAKNVTMSQLGSGVG